VANAATHAENEVRRLQGCINDRISIQAMPAIWSGQDSARIVGALLDVLVRVLRLDFAYSRLSDSIKGSPVEAHGGKLWPNVRPGETFQLTLPLSARTAS
jgi:hypothetical protein